ncbi:polysaccharide deacetylase family protein [Candidatus Woesearchaeota archaeon]|nr:polysaccharide deacetylase family protein [Candidatus Woesearchaeota archaeon]
MYADISLNKIMQILSLTIILSLSVILTLNLEIGYVSNANLFSSLIKNNYEYLKYKSDISNGGNAFLVTGLFSIFKNDVGEDSSTETANLVPVLLYHGILDKSDGENVLLKDFKEQMFALKRNGWNTITLEELHGFINEGKKLPDKSFLLTFDDGRKDSYYPVDPILKALDYNAVIFVITKYSLTQSSKYYLDKNELKEMLKSGRWEIQSHTKEGHTFYVIDQTGTKGHFYSDRLWLSDRNRLETEEEFTSRITKDFQESKSELEKYLDTKVISFAYPFGDYGQNSVNYSNATKVVLKTIAPIYQMTFYQAWGEYSQNSPNNKILVKRIEVDKDWNAQKLLEVINSGREKDITYTDNFEQDSGWVTRWGETLIDNNKLQIKSTEFSSGALVFLDGTQHWTNYQFNAEVHAIKGESITLVANYKDELNYDSCVFSTKYVKIEQIINGTKKILVLRKGASTFIGATRELGISTNNNQLSCSIGNTIIVKSKPPYTVKSSGGIGFKIWDPILNNSEIEIKNISVEPITL